MKLPDTMRPGIYTQISVTPLYATPRGRRHCGVAAVAASHTGEKLYLDSYREAAALFAAEGDRPLLRILGTLFRQGVLGVWLAAVAEEEAGEQLAAYQAALDQLAETPGLGVILCDSPDLAVLQALRTTVLAEAEHQRELLGLCAVADPTAAAEAAQALGCERVLLCCGSALAEGEHHPAHLAAALAGVILAADDPSVNLSGAAMEGVEGLAQHLSHRQVEQLLQAGAIPFEEVAGQVECIRGVTTRTKTQGLEDTTYRSVNTVLIIDRVMETLRSTLRARLRGSKNNPQTRESIRSQVTVELAQAVDEGLLEEFASPRVYPHPDDTSVCVVEVAFTVAQVVNQIVITAQIRV